MPTTVRVSTAVGASRPTRRHASAGASQERPPRASSRSRREARPVGLWRLGDTVPGYHRKSRPHRFDVSAAGTTRQPGEPQSRLQIRKGAIDEIDQVFVLEARSLAHFQGYPPPPRRRLRRSTAKWKLALAAPVEVPIAAAISAKASLSKPIAKTLRCLGGSCQGHWRPAPPGPRGNRHRPHSRPQEWAQPGQAGRSQSCAA